LPGLPAAEGACFAPELLLAQLAEAGRFLLLALHARLFVVLAAARFGEDAVLLDALVEPLERAFEGLVVTNNDFGQGFSPASPRRFTRPAGIADFTR